MHRRSSDSLPSWEPGAVVDGTSYRVLEHLGEGAMGVVYKVVHVDGGPPRALKVLRSVVAGDPSVEERLLREIVALERLRGAAHLVAVRESGRLPSGRPFFVMDLLEGEPLRAALARGPWSPGAAARFVRQLLAALWAAHAANVVHRDVKPENLFVGPDGACTLLDFGLVKALSEGGLAPGRFATGPGEIVGTGPYLAPELATRGRADARADLYAAGVVFWEMLSGGLPYPEVPTGALFQHIVEHGFPSLEEVGAQGVPPALAAVVRRATLSNPDARYQTVREFVEALDDAAEHDGVWGEPAPAHEAEAPKPARVRVPRAAVAVAALAGVLAAVAVARRRPEIASAASAPSATIMPPAPSASVEAKPAPAVAPTQSPPAPSAEALSAPSTPRLPQARPVHQHRQRLRSY